MQSLLVATIIIVHNSQQLHVSVTDRLTIVFTVRAGIFTKRITKSIHVIFSIAVTPEALIHHVYKTEWNPIIGEELCYWAEEVNTFDRFAVVVSRDGRIVGHVPLELARTFLRKDTARLPVE